MLIHYQSVYERILRAINKSDIEDRPIERIELTAGEYDQLCDEISKWDLNWYAKAVLNKHTIVGGIEVHQEDL